MTEKKYNNEINFVKQEVISVSEQERSRKLEISSFILAGLTLFLTIIVSVFKIYTISELAKVKDTEANLVAQIQAPDLRHKEEFFFLIKNRLVKIKEIDSSRTIMSKFLKTFSDIDNVIKIQDFSLNLNLAKMTMMTDDYSRFEDFVKHLADFQIDKKSVVVNQVAFADGKYNIPIQFIFKKQ